MIRPARREDLDQLVPLFEEVFNNSPFAPLGDFDRLYMQRMFTIACAMPNFFAWVAEHDGKVVGVMGGMVADNIFGVRVATDLITYSKKDTHRLMREFKRWAKDQGAKVISITNISGQARYDRLIELVGLHPVGTTFQEIL